jgi:Chloride channel protein EriC
VLGSGHGELNTLLTTHLTLGLMLALLLAKTLASAISIGCGFRGGLFSASLLIGGFLGSAFWLVCFHFFPADVAVNSAYAVVGIGAVAASVVGAPMTMILLVFETTSDYTVTLGVALAVIIATVGTRRWFGYSFSTWRFHLKGVGLKGAYDIGRMYDLTVRRVLDRDILRVEGATKLTELPSALPRPARAHRLRPAAGRDLDRAHRRRGGQCQARRARRGRGHGGEPRPSSGQAADPAGSPQHRSGRLGRRRVRLRPGGDVADRSAADRLCP